MSSSDPATVSTRRCIDHMLLHALSTVLLITLALGLPSHTYGVEATPGPVDDRFARSFLFHPAETGVLTAFNVEIEVGNSAELAVFIGNSGSETFDVRIYPVNVFTGENGGLIADDFGAEPNNVARWLDFPEEVLTIEPGRGTERTFIVTVPEGTPPGEYIAAVAGEHADAYDVEGSESFRQRTRYVTPVFITVPGEMNAAFSFGQPDLEIAEDVLLIQVPVNNDGTMHVRPVGAITLRDANRNIIATVPITMQSVFARESTTLTIALSGDLPPGTYQLEGKFSDADTGATAVIENATIDATVAATPVPEQYRFASASVAAEPTTDNVQFVTVEAGIVNIGDPATGVQLSLIAFLDGEEVERFPINQSLSLPTGETPITTRYIPATGFTPGEWSFELLLETVAPGGAAVVVARTTIAETIIVPD